VGGGGREWAGACPFFGGARPRAFFLSGGGFLGGGGGGFAVRSSSDKCDLMN